jgi:RND family efflux transporter MFP subunit
LEQVPYEDSLRAIGSATAMRSVDVVSEGAGKVTAVFLPANGRVEEGDVLLELDDRVEALNVVAAQAALDQATETVTRYERLRSGGSSTVTDVTLSDARLAQRLAEAELGLAQIALEDLTIRAPISGRLGLSDIDVGDVISANSVITTIDETDALLVEFELPERAIAMLDRESTILASTPALRGKVFEGEITSYDSRIDSVTRSITVRAQIDNADEQLWPGMTFSVRLLHESDPLPMVPSTAITWSRAGSSIWVNDTGKAKSVPVTILYRVDQQVWIQADLPEGAMIVSEGAQKLREGAAIVDAGARPSGGRPAQEAADATPARDPA